MSLPEQYDTLVGEKGVSSSGRSHRSNHCARAQDPRAGRGHECSGRGERTSGASSSKRPDGQDSDDDPGHRSPLEHHPSGRQDCGGG
ncbi:hypothetical protein V7S43_018986 [Phytophthora oleae]|uniref:Uncharacterized protein n=1 Tax=Phytophthora oleae TaxID=2107226 RepID=A0ABD3ET55_9STRA